MADMPAGNAAARSFEELRAQILERRADLPGRLLQIAVFALDNPDDIAFGTVASIAAALDAPPSALIRFAQFFGFDGFSSLQQLFRERLLDRRSEYEERLRGLYAASPEGDQDILSGFFAAAHRSLDQARSAVSRSTFEDAVALLAPAETIYLIARRRSYPLVAHMAYAFGKLRVRHVIAGTAMGIDDDLLAMATRRDAVFAASFAPYASETVAQARRAAERGVPMVVLTDSPFSPLAELAICRFEVAEADFAGFRLLSASLALTMALTVAVAERRLSSDSE